MSRAHKRFAVAGATVAAIAFAAGLGAGQSIDSARANQPEAQLAAKKKLGTQPAPTGIPSRGLLTPVCISGFKSNPKPPYGATLQSYSCRSWVVSCKVAPFTKLQSPKYDGQRFSYTCAKPPEVN